MTKEEVLSFLKENLSVNVSTERGRYGGSDSITVSIMLGEECISESSATITLGD